MANGPDWEKIRKDRLDLTEWMDAVREPNVALLSKVLDHITAHSSEWNQQTWASVTACGTSFCFAGHAAIISGSAPPASSSFTTTWRVDWRTGETLAPGVRGTPYTSVSVGEYARVVLGLDTYEAGQLFAGDNNLARLEMLVARFSAEATTPHE